MGIVNDALNHFMDNPEVFADFCNGILYNGRNMISPEDLAEHQKFYYEDLLNRTGEKRKPTRERDVAKLLCLKNGRIIIAIENQDEENFCMPLRCMEYETEDLNRQLRRMKQRYDTAKDLKGGAEFLSGIRRTDRFIPTAQIVIYHGKGEWNAPRSVRDMLNLTDVDESFMKFVSDYRIQVIHLARLDETKFKTGLRELIAMLKRRNNHRAMQAYCRKHADRFGNIDDATYDLICVMLHLPSLKLRKENYRRSKGEKINMCKAFEDWAKQEQAKGEKRGEKRGQKEGEERMGTLMLRLHQDNRFEEAGKAVKSPAIRKKLYLEYGL